jgi:S1-C subfamily serine protease
MGHRPRPLTTAAVPLLAALLTAGCAAPPLRSDTAASLASAAGAIDVAAELAVREVRTTQALAAGIAMPGPDRPRRTGSGFFVGMRQLVTNDHVTAGCAKLAVRIGGRGPWGAARLTAADSDLDLALLESDLPANAPASFDAATVVPPGRLAIVGYPARGGTASESDPSLTPAAALPEDPGTPGAMLPLSADVRHGHSGSPVLDEEGAVVGVVAKKLYTIRLAGLGARIEEGAGLAIPADTVIGFLAAHGVAYRTRNAAEAPLPPGQRLEKARGYVAQVRCWS